MKTCKIILITGSLVFIFLSSFYRAEAAIEKELKALVTININWDKDEHKGFMQFRFNATLIANENFSSTEQLESPRPVFIPYKLQQARASVNYVSKTIDKKPTEGAPELISIYEYSGPVKIKTDLTPGPLIIRYMGSMLKQISQVLKQQGMGDMKIPIPAEAKNAMTDNYMFVLPTDKVHTKGKQRHYRIVCCNNAGESYKEWYYKDIEKDITLGSLKLENIQIGDDGKLSGSQTWKADAKLLNPALAGRKGDDTVFPNSPEEDPNGDVNYSVNWAFGKQLPPQVNIQSVAFNTGENKEKEIVLTLSELNSDSDITPPEWTEAGKNKPAALILGNKFKVKAVFKVEKGLKKAKVWAEEDVIEGNGGFGGIEEKTVDVENGRIEAEFTIKTPQDVIGINEVRWIWKVQDKTRDKETTDTEAGVSRHKIFIIGPGPGNKILGTEYKKYVYIVKNGCKWAADTTGGDETFNKIWENFWDIPAPEGGGILSYRHTTPEVYTTRNLLYYGHGRCKAWQRFFYATMACQGVQTEKIGIRPKQPLDLLIVKKQGAQGNANPNRIFKNHTLNAYKGKYYDPSYHSDPIPRGGGPLLYETESIIAYCDCSFLRDCKLNELVGEALSMHFFNKLFPNTFNTCGDFLLGGDDIRFVACLSNEEFGCFMNDPGVCEVEEY
ncbi:MAG: hypothetical protein SV375_05630 [Thermodesulfobacteriota bacterium]|nr:hypothetical protein [Thermodesulfobacteriota bacterium]